MYPPYLALWDRAQATLREELSDISWYECDEATLYTAYVITVIATTSTNVLTHKGTEW